MRWVGRLPAERNTYREVSRHLDQVAVCSLADLQRGISEQITARDARDATIERLRANAPVSLAILAYRLSAPLQRACRMPRLSSSGKERLSDCAHSQKTKSDVHPTIGSNLARLCNRQPNGCLTHICCCDVPAVVLAEICRASETIYLVSLCGSARGRPGNLIHPLLVLAVAVRGAAAHPVVRPGQNCTSTLQLHHQASRCRQGIPAGP